ncbi:Hypothetical_protein [Hexamita inflata]|uniref:Hypothetical_protein n=1 Tax=Hexamita inflata TaxID=28002 RepID=A0ABP1HE43_9EUKA
MFVHVTGIKIRPKSGRKNEVQRKLKNEVILLQYFEGYVMHYICKISLPNSKKSFEILLQYINQFNANNQLVTTIHFHHARTGNSLINSFRYQKFLIKSFQHKEPVFDVITLRYLFKIGFIWKLLSFFYIVVRSFVMIGKVFVCYPSQ